MNNDWTNINIIHVSPYLSNRQREGIKTLFHKRLLGDERQDVAMPIVDITTQADDWWYLSDAAECSHVESNLALLRVSSLFLSDIYRGYQFTALLILLFTTISY
jgi:hypothetical protein